MKPWFVLLLALALALARAEETGPSGEGCGPCDPDSCTAVKCRAPELLAKDACGCCPLCLGVEGEPCGGVEPAGRGRCAQGYVCLTAPGGDGAGAAVGGARDAAAQAGAAGSGECMCKHDFAVCGSDAKTYATVCALHLASWLSAHAGRSKVHKEHDGECKYAPVIVTTPKNIVNVTGSQVYLSCEVKAVPLPIVTWRKVTESPKGVKLLEELPGDRINLAVQVRGGPSKYESTAWVLINPLTRDDAGTYQCHAKNSLGETQAESSIKVVEGKIKAAGGAIAKEGRGDSVEGASK